MGSEAHKKFRELLAAERKSAKLTQQDLAIQLSDPLSRDDESRTKLVVGAQEVTIL